MLLPAWSLLSQNSALKPCIAMASNGIKRGSALKQYASSCSITSTRRHAMCDVACTYPQLTCKYHMVNVLLSQVTQLGFDMLFDSIKWCKPCTSAKKPGKIQRIWHIGMVATAEFKTVLNSAVTTHLQPGPMGPWTLGCTFQFMCFAHCT